MSLALLPPFRFSTIEEKLYRGAYPTLKNFRFLKRLQLQTIISVIPESPTSDLIEFCKLENIKSYHFTAERFTSDNVTVKPSIVSNILQIILEEQHLPIYLHCLDGANISGIIVALLRRLQNWSPSAIISEFCRFTRDHTIEKDEAEYLNGFSEDVVVPLRVSPFMWHGIRIHKHPTIRLRHDPPLSVECNVEQNGNDTTNSSNLGWRSEESKGRALLRQIEDRQLLIPSIIEDIEVLSEDGELETGIRVLSRTLEGLNLEGLDTRLSRHMHD